ncbi:MAG: hypothetical protein H0V17_03545, partial [Deltaproteobacteria bacterium]|nr:hypothetical protein [Deltaproteobacteria bacterium]
MNRLVLVTCLLVIWCASSVAAPNVRLFTDDEIKKFESALRARFVSNKTRSCPRPVLRGTPAAGRAITDQLVFEKPTGTLATCLTSLVKLSGKAGLYDAVEARNPD